MSEVATVTPRELQAKSPEKNSVEKANKVFYALKKATRESSIARNGERSDRSLDLRATRAELYKKITSTTDQGERKKLLAEAHARDEIEAQYLSQGEIKIDLPGLGEQSARYTMIEPPEGRKIPGRDGKPPVFLIPGISNDIDSVGSLVKEIAYQGLPVVVVGMPDSQMGHATANFASSVEQSKTLEAHVQFFKAAMDKLIGQDEPVELWGMSAGSMITAEILNDPKYQERTKQAVLLSPAGTSKQGLRRQDLGVATEALKVFKNPGKGAHYSLTMSRQEDQVSKTKENQEIAGRVFKAIREKTLSKFEPYKTMKVAEGGQITVVSGTKDNMTRSRESDEEFKTHPQVELLSILGGVHNTPIIEANVVLPEIFETQKISQIRSELG